jgi:hypothetical protein
MDASGGRTGARTVRKAADSDKAFPNSRGSKTSGQYEEISLGNVPQYQPKQLKTRYLSMAQNVLFITVLRSAPYKEV